MRTLINYIRQCFCKHDLIREEGIGIVDRKNEIVNRRVYVRCRKCSYHREFWKYGQDGEQA